MPGEGWFGELSYVSGWKGESRKRAGLGKWEEAVGLDLAHG